MAEASWMMLLLFELTKKKLIEESLQVGAGMRKP